MLPLIPAFRYETLLTLEYKSTVRQLVASAAIRFEPRFSLVNQCNAQKMAPASLTPGTEFEGGGRP